MRRGAVSAESAAEDDGPYERKVYPKSEEARRRLKQAVAHNILFSHLDDAQLDEVTDAFFEVAKGAGEAVIRQGEEGDNFYILDSGECEIFVQKGSAPPVKVFTARAGNSFGELALMYNCPRAATVKAVGSVVLWGLDRVSFQRILKSTASERRKQYEGFLEQVPLLQSLTGEERAKIADVLEEHVFRDGEHIIRQGEEGHHFYIIAEGGAAVLKSMGPGQPEQEVMAMRAGQFFGELALLRDQPRAASVVARGRCKVVALDRASFTRLLGPCDEILARQEAEYEATNRRLKS